MTRRRVARRALISLGVVLALLLASVAGTAAVMIRRPLPTHAGELTISGLSDTVIVLRDARGVPTITASSAHDLFLAQGYTDAQDRFFLMDYRRRAASGTLSALVGPHDAVLHSDMVVRTMGWRQVAEQEWELLRPATRQHLQSYADGVNAYLAGRSAREVAVEYTVLGLRVPISAPKRWEPVDSLVWLKAMAWDLSSSFHDELSRAAAYQTLQDVALVDQLFPAYPEDVNAPILSTADVPITMYAAAPESVDLTSVPVLAALASTRENLDALPPLLGTGEGVGSNSWAVSGRHTASGKPLLANDPHLAISQPGVWSQVGLRCAEVSQDCPFDVSGFSFAGFPGVIIGHNQTLAWGLTNLGADVTDFFVERVVSGDGVLVDGVVRPMQVREETIEIAGADPVTIEVRTTGHGPIVSDVLGMDAVSAVPLGGGRGTYEVALAWTALEPGVTADAVFALSTAVDAADVQAAAAAFEVPSQNIVFATTDGHIGYQAPGRIPVRAHVVGAELPSDGTWPRPGWDSAYDWQGYVDPADMPRVLDPEEGFIVAANQAVTPAGVGPPLSRDWDYGYRSQRIRDLLLETIEQGGVTVTDMERIAIDKHSAAADLLVPLLLEQDVGDGFDADGQALLRDWDRQMDADSAAAMYFAAVWAEVLMRTYSDELPEAFELSGDSRSVELIRQIIDSPDSRWWDDVSTPRVVENRDEVLSRALVNARRELTAQLGSAPTSWRWGTLHRATPRHPVLGGDDVPALVRALVNPAPRSVGGGSSVVDATAWDAASGSYEVRSGPSARMVVDLSDLDSSTWVNLTGTSGHPASVHYSDQLAAWADGRSYPWPFTPAAVRADAELTLRLSP
ncbi:MAG: penicillin acylase family protein [Micrococcales bacterium]|nr:penicillin acylase family protein [Micrococcales bacterium]